MRHFSPGPFGHLAKTTFQGEWTNSSSSGTLEKKPEGICHERKVSYYSFLRYRPRVSRNYANCVINYTFIVWTNASSSPTLEKEPAKILRPGEGVRVVLTSESGLWSLPDACRMSHGASVENLRLPFPCVVADCWQKSRYTYVSSSC